MTAMKSSSLFFLPSVTRAPTKKMWKSLKAASCRRTKSECGIFTQKTMATGWSREISYRSAKTRYKILSSARGYSLLAVCVNLSCLFKNKLGLISFSRILKLYFRGKPRENGRPGNGVTSTVHLVLLLHLLGHFPVPACITCFFIQSAEHSWLVTMIDRRCRHVCATHLATVEGRKSLPNGEVSLCAQLHPLICICNFRSKWIVFSGCLMSQQHARVSQDFCSDNCVCIHTEIAVADQTFYLTQSQNTDTRPTTPNADLLMSGTWQDSHWSANF